MHIPTKLNLVNPKIYSVQNVEHPPPEGFVSSTMLDGAVRKCGNSTLPNHVSPKADRVQQCFAKYTQRHIWLSKDELCTTEDKLNPATLNLAYPKVGLD
jgi:hypothetical protein